MIRVPIRHPADGHLEKPVMNPVKQAKQAELTHEMGLEELQHIVVIPGGLFAFASSAGFSRTILGEQVDGDFAQRGKVAGGDSIANPAVILSKGDIQHPMQIVFDGPVTADGLR